MNLLQESCKKENAEVEISQRIADRKEILFDGYFYDVTDFIKRHPGGNVITYYTKPGEDATHAIQQFHHRSINKVNAMMSSLKKRPASDVEIGTNVEVLKKNRALTHDFTKLFLELEREGLFEPSYTHNILRTLELFVMGAVGYSLLQSENFVTKCIGIFLIGLTQGRSGWLQHESGHNSLSGNPKVDRILHAFFIGLGLGSSSLWWRRQHNRHHAMPQRLNYDVDLNTTPLIAFHAKAVKNSKDGKGFLIQNQAYLFFIFDTLLVGLLWKIRIHPIFAFKNKRYLELTFMLAHWLLIYVIGFWPWLLGTWVSAIYLFGNFALNHTFLPVTTEPTHWVEYSLMHTADVEQSAWCNWVMGYLNYQIEHHLFPTMPQFRNPLIKDRVKALAEKHNIPYIVHSYPEAMWKVFKNLSNVAKELKHT